MRVRPEGTVFRKGLRIVIKINRSKRVSTVAGLDEDASLDPSHHRGHGLYRNRAPRCLREPADALAYRAAAEIRVPMQRSSPEARSSPHWLTAAIAIPRPMGGRTRAVDRFGRLAERSTARTSRPTPKPVSAAGRSTHSLARCGRASTMTAVICIPSCRTTISPNSATTT